MARMRRKATGGTWHHVMNRGARQLPIFGNDDDREAFIALLGDAVDRTPIHIHAYALMPNHFHLLIEAEVDALATGMKLIALGYTSRFNRRYGYDGALFRGRYRSKPIGDDRGLCEVARYIHRNPLEGEAPRPSLRWTSHPRYLGQTGQPTWLTTHRVLAAFGNNAADFDRYVRGDAPTPVTDLLDDVAIRPATPRDVEAALGVESSQERAVLQAGGRGVRNDVRLAALLLGHRHTSAGVEHLAARYGYRDPTVARSAIARADARLARDSAFRAVVYAAEQRLGVARRESTGV